VLETYAAALPPFEITPNASRYPFIYSEDDRIVTLRPGPLRDRFRRVRRQTALATFSIPTAVARGGGFAQC
jgi:hypothetical protein